MKNLVFKNCLLSCVFIFGGIISPAQAIDSVRYIKLANATIHEANAGFIPNVTKLIQTQEVLVEIGIAGSKEFIRQFPEHADILGEVIDNADNMMSMSLAEIENRWHQGNHMREKGFDLDKLDHFGPLFSLMDAIIHPATAHISLTEYKRTRNTQFLDRVSAELVEVIEHVSHINKDSLEVLSQQ